MPDLTTIQIPGLESLIEAISTLPDQALPLAEKAMDLSCLAVEGILAEYPPETAANQPGRKDEQDRPLPYYERNRGTWYPVTTQMAFGRAGKSRGRYVPSAKKREAWGVTMYKLRPTSEQLGRKWTHRVNRLQNGVEGVIGNTASYAAAVEGSKEDQSSLMAGIGWPSIDDALAKAGPDIQAAWESAINQLRL